MGKVKVIEAETDNDWPVSIRCTGVTLPCDQYTIELTTNDLEQLLALVRYLRDTSPMARIEDKVTQEVRAVNA